MSVNKITSSFDEAWSAIIDWAQSLNQYEQMAVYSIVVVLTIVSIIVGLRKSRPKVYGTDLRKNMEKMRRDAPHKKDQ